MRTVFAVATMVTALVCAWKNAGKAEETRAAPPERELGRRLYLWAGCGMCHGFDARGAWRGPDLTDPGLLRVRTDDDIFDVIKHGRSDTMMGYYGDELADEQIRAIVAFLRDQGDKRDASPP